MTHSFKKNPVGGNVGAPSEKKDKQLASRAVRKKVKMKLEEVKVGIVDPEEVLLPDELEIASNYDFSKDGKSRFDPEEYPKGMRK